MIGIAIPAHNEEDYLEACLTSIFKAISHSLLRDEEVSVVLVLDNCTDKSEQIAKHFDVDVLSVGVNNVGIARSIGANHLLQKGARWLSFTDADTQVSDSWIVDQLSLGADAVCGTVHVNDWSPHGVFADILKTHFSHHYEMQDGHRHIHGANLGLSSEAYNLAGGFQALKCSEDVALVESLMACGVEIAWSVAPKVYTSARKQARARGGFGDTLEQIVHNAMERKSEAGMLDSIPLIGVAG